MRGVAQFGSARRKGWEYVQLLSPRRSYFDVSVMSETSGGLATLIRA